MGSQFPRLFREYYTIHKTINTILSETNGGPLQVDEVARRVREKHPDLGMGPATLAAAIRHAERWTFRPEILTARSHRGPNYRGELRVTQPI